jgi:uncharacterized protein (DUF305 family)
MIFMSLFARSRAPLHFARNTRTLRNAGSVVAFGYQYRINSAAKQSFLGVAIVRAFSLCCVLGVIVGAVSWAAVAFEGNATVGENAEIEVSPAPSALVRVVFISEHLLTPTPEGTHIERHRRRMLSGLLLTTGAITGLFYAASFLSLTLSARQTDSAKPVVVQPGAPGQPSKTLPPSTKGTLPPRSQADVEFMQGMIMHHAQAVEMTALIDSHTENKELRLLGARISSSQSDEIRFMRRWLAARGETTSMAMPQMPGMDMSHETMPLMPGMLSPEQMEALRKAKGADFDRLFLTGMIQHHGGALTMVKDLFDTAGAGQDADIFNFATDADNTQRAEIKIMQTMLEKKTSEEKR